MRTNILGTSLEQAKKLIDAGLNPDTADLHYSNEGVENYDMTIRMETYKDAKVRYANIEFDLFFAYSPAWSIGTLWNILHQSGLKYAPTTLTMDSRRLLDLLVIWVIDALNQGRISQEFLTSAEASEE